jgi:hypothetical protein
VAPNDNVRRYCCWAGLGSVEKGVAPKKEEAVVAATAASGVVVVVSSSRIMPSKFRPAVGGGGVSCWIVRDRLGTGVSATTVLEILLVVVIVVAVLEVELELVRGRLCDKELWVVRCCALSDKDFLRCCCWCCCCLEGPDAVGGVMRRPSVLRRNEEETGVLVVVRVLSSQPASPKLLEISLNLV